MRIGIDAHLVGAEPAGVGKSILNTAGAMADAAPSDEFIIYANRQFPETWGPRRSDGEAGRPNCRVVRTPLIARSRVLRILHERFVMPRRVVRDKLDVFYAPGYVFPGELCVPIVLGVADLNALKHPNLVRPETAFYYKHALPATAKRAALIVTPTFAVAADVRDILGVPDDRIRVVPGAVDERFGRAPGDPGAAARRFGVDGPYVLFVGNIEPNKNLGRLIEAFFAARMNRALPHKLIIAGKRRYRAERLVRLVRLLGCGELVVFPGYVRDEDLPGLYAGASAFVYPSHAEGFGMPPLEAMRSGTPTITSADAAVVEVTGAGALHFASNDLAALREALERVLTDAAFAAELSARGREIAARYSWAETGRKTLDVLREAVKPPV